MMENSMYIPEWVSADFLPVFDIAMDSGFILADPDYEPNVDKDMGSWYDPNAPFAVNGWLRNFRSNLWPLNYEYSRGSRINTGLSNGNLRLMVFKKFEPKMVKLTNDDQKTVIDALKKCADDAKGLKVPSDSLGRRAEKILNMMFPKEEEEQDA